MASFPSSPLLLDTTGDFAALRRSGMLYVDKTETIARLVGYARGTNVFFARPRRFGKSLLVSTLAALFRGADSFFARNDLNADTWIYRHGTWDWSEDNRFPVIHLNLNITDVHEAALLREELHFLIRRLCTVHEAPALPDDTRLSPARGLSQLIDNIHTRTGREVVVLIDEYDAPITANLGRPELEDILDLMRAFYGAVKDCTGIIRFSFMTGVTRFARTGLFSGANNLEDLSLDPGFHDLAGITTTELDGALAPHVQHAARALDLPLAEVRQALAAYYNGYRFGPVAAPVYNPYSLLRCLRDMTEPDTAALLQTRGLRQGLPNYWAASGSPRFLVRALESGAYDLAGLPRNADRIEKVHYQIDQPDYAALMHQTGYLTRKGSPERGWYLDFPNREVQITFMEFVVQERERKLPVLDHTLRDAVAQAVLRADPDALAEAFSACLAGLGYPHHPPADLPRDGTDTGAAARRGWASRWHYETHYQALLCNTLRMAGLIPWIEVPTARGRIDAAVDLDDRVCVFEIKLNQSAAEALRQACIGDYPGLFAATCKRVAVIGLNLDTRARTIEACWVYNLGRYCIEAAQWEREPFARSLRELALAGNNAPMDLDFSAEGLARSQVTTGAGI